MIDAVVEGGPSGAGQAVSASDAERVARRHLADGATWELAAQGARELEEDSDLVARGADTAWADEEADELGADTVQEHLPGLSVDERKLIEMEARENREQGCDTQNEDTFGASSGSVWTFEDQCAANARLPDRWPVWQRSVDEGLAGDGAGKLEERASELHESVWRTLAWEDAGCDDDETPLMLGSMTRLV